MTAKLGASTGPIFLGDDVKNEWVYKNPDASAPLRVPYDLTCNTAETQILKNVLENSKKCDRWVKRLPAHDRLAVVCGSGPSLQENLDEVRKLTQDGATLYALNGSAKFLDIYGLLPDYQVIMDARLETASLVGPAKEHLFCSQVHPETLKRAQNLTLWHATFGNLMVDDQEGFPEHHDDYAIIGSAITAGITVLILLYALGYRRVICFGYDSSHRNGKGHAFAQPINNDDPCTLVNFRGKDYLASFTMSAQAKHFLGFANALKDMGMSIEVRGDGLLPDMYNAKLTEKEKYEEMWKHFEYREEAPGETCVDKFLEIAKPEAGSSVIDFGCGTGRASIKLHQAGLDVTMVDFAKNCRDYAAQALKFVEADLSESIDVTSEYGFCTDVMEHIPPDQVDKVITNIMRASGRVFFQISLLPDGLGALIGHTLHLSVHPHDWWKAKFEQLGYSVTWSEDQVAAALYYVTN